MKNPVWELELLPVRRKFRGDLDVARNLFRKYISVGRGLWEFYYINDAELFYENFFYVYMPYEEKGSYGPVQVGMFYHYCDFSLDPEPVDWNQYSNKDGRTFYREYETSRFVVVPPDWHSLRRRKQNSERSGPDDRGTLATRLVKMCVFAHARPLEPWGGF